MPCIGLFGVVWLIWFGLIVLGAVQRSRAKRAEPTQEDRVLADILRQEFDRALDNI